MPIAPELTRRTKLVLAGILLVALVVRLGAIAATPDQPLAADPKDYDRHARSIAAGDGYPRSQVTPRGGATAVRPPGFPYALGAVYRLTGDSVTAGRIFQALVGTAIVALAAVIALMVWGGGVAMATAALAAVFPPLVIDGMTLLSEPLFVTFALAAVVAALRWRDTRRAPWLVGAGVLVGLACLTRSNGVLLLLPLIAATRAAGPWRSPATYRPPLVLLACAVLVVLPWTIRNAIEMDAFVPITTQDGYTLIGTYNATSRANDGAWRVGTADPDVTRLLARSHGLDEVDLNRELRSEARAFAREHPGYVLEVAGRNTLRLFNLGGADFEREIASGDHGLGSDWARLMTFGLFPFLGLALGGAFTPAARGAPRWLWAIPALMLVPVLVLATNRTRAPIDPFMLMLAALAVLWLAGRAERARGPFPPRTEPPAPSRA